MFVFILVLKLVRCPCLWIDPCRVGTGSGGVRIGGFGIFNDNLLVLPSVGIGIGIGVVRVLGDGTVLPLSLVVVVGMLFI